MKNKYLPTIKSPADLKKYSVGQLEQVAAEIRDLIIKTVSTNGGHLAPNLGTVELTLALHYSYDSPRDKLIWDVGHQAYTHKILTGRAEQFATIRQYKGLSGYLQRQESEHDIYGGGHVGTAVSAALGFAQARDLLGEKHKILAIIGDGSLTNGLTFEGINNIGHLNTDITVVLNDNKWSISRNIGGIAKYLEKLSATRVEGVETTDLELIFRALGFTCFGPIDGHNIKALIDAFALAKETPGPKIVHVLTKKGRGYIHSENNPDIFHSTNPFILESGKTLKDTSNLTYTKAFGQALIKIAQKNKRVIAITAAMPAGTGVDEFAAEFPDRFFDAGIAEEHAVLFAAGLALRGFRPVVAIYSTFLQRAYDQILHDIALQKIPIVFALDRAGIVGTDGPTHHGLFDLSYLRHIPNLTILAPKDEDELQHMLYSAVNYKRGPIAIRYPRGEGIGVSLKLHLQEIPIGQAEQLSSGQDLAVIAIGSMVYPALEAAELLQKKGIRATVYNARSVKPIDSEMIGAAAKIGRILTVEENVLEGGFGSAVLEELAELDRTGIKVRRLGVTGFVEHGEVARLRQLCGLTVANIAKTAIDLTGNKRDGG
ncbi:MAG: 1-deoxy-D-xylulose-5-phosphate synthase [Patescibacteria group bacterium]